MGPVEQKWLKAMLRRNDHFCDDWNAFREDFRLRFQELILRGAASTLQSGFALLQHVGMACVGESHGMSGN